MIPISEALAFIGREARPLGTETVRLENCVGRVLAETVSADLDLPPFDRSQMDGFAVLSSDTNAVPARLRIVGESVAGKGFDGVLKSGEAVRIMTGARVPKGADAVQQVEKTSESDGFVEILKSTDPGQNIVFRAQETAVGDVVFRAGEVITDKMIAALASFGCAEVAVGKRPSLAILATGCEIVDIATTPERDQIRNSNSAMLRAFAASLGIEATVYPAVGDDLESLTASIRTIIESKPDILILTGGVSVGDYDFTKPALKTLGASLFFEKVSLKPGKPTVFARHGETLVFGLPGNPVSVAVTFYLFVRFAVMLMQDAARPELKRGRAVATRAIKGARERDCLLPVSLDTDENGRLMIESVRFAGSSNFIAFSGADALAHVPIGKVIAPEEIVEVYFL
ncbi:MAG: molybdopterin molybdotransferase MoeA [Acidobacteria bacterium]|nr:molybdopterin molybdotransferase MoeA [Acidobacteriota bacterium]